MTERRFNIRVAVGGRLLVDARDVTLVEGGITLLFGESGIGKSLVGKTLFGLLDESEYAATVNGEWYSTYTGRPEVVRARERGFFVFQEPSSHLNPLQTLDAQLREGMLAEAQDPIAPVRELWAEGDRGQIAQIIPVFPKPYRPSGGEKQRILDAMALAKMDAGAERGGAGFGLFIFDEPTGSLDREARDRFLDRLFARFKRRRETVLLITHDYGIIRYVQSRHPSLIPDIRFTELVLEGGVARGRSFAPQRFFEWLGRQHTGLPEEPRPLVLNVESGVRVFGRTLAFTGAGGSSAETGLAVHSGELVYLKAGSGVGKTTVAKVVMGLQRAEHVRMIFSGERFSEATAQRRWQRQVWGKSMTMAFQHADEALNLRSTVEETLRLLPIAPLRTGGGIRDALGRLFDAEEIARLRKRMVWQLSGGQKQRLNLLRAFALSTPLIILDEPLSALDFESIDRVLVLMREARKRGQAMLLISHNEDIFDAVVPPSSVYMLKQTA
jgi:ABC-type glutathione transport system ATPase component